MTLFHEQREVIAKIVRSMTSQGSPRSWCLLIPPGFADESEIAKEFAAELRTAVPDAPVALVSADALPSREDYVRQLRRQWRGAVDPDADELGDLLSGLSADRPAYQVLMRFNKIVKTLDQWVLGDLREAEQSGRLRTVAITPLSYGELKRRWRAEQIAFCVSDYGDKHLKQEVRSAPQSMLDSHIAELGIPSWLRKHILGITGGFPAVIDAVVARWEAEGSPVDWNAGLKLLLRETSDHCFERLMSSIDGPGETRFRDAVCDLYQGLNRANARYLLTQHDWRHVILEGDRICAESMGSVAEGMFAKQIGSDSSLWHDVWKRGVELYKMGQYASVRRMFEHFDKQVLRDHLFILQQNSRIMELLHGPNTDGGAISPRWNEISVNVKTALAFLQTQQHVMPDGELFLRPQLAAISTMVEGVLSVLTSGSRYIDTLSGLKSHPPNGLATAMVLALEVRVCESQRRLGNDDVSIRLMLALPEQLLRTWGKFALGVNYYSAPADCENVWAAATQLWDKNESRKDGGYEIVRSNPGEKFRDVRIFGYFLYAFAEGIAFEGNMLEPNIQAMKKSLALFDARNDNAHAVSINSPSIREGYFSLVLRWFERVCEVCCGVARTEVESFLEPLPLVSEDGCLTP